jgi:hypothetical protein
MFAVFGFVNDYRIRRKGFIHKQAANDTVADLKLKKIRPHFITEKIAVCLIRLAGFESLVINEA